MKLTLHTLNELKMLTITARYVLRGQSTREVFKNEVALAETPHLLQSGYRASISHKKYTLYGDYLSRNVL